MRLLLILAHGALLFASCDYVDDPTPPTSGPDNTSTTVKRRALLEEFTGHRCTTCPAAHAVAANLAGAFGEKLIIVGVHATEVFAAPLNPPAADGSYSTDFRTPAGEEYIAAFNVSFIPTGVISRKPYNSSVTISSGNWSSAIADIVDDDALCDLWFSELDYDAGTQTVSAEVKVAVLRPISGDHNLTVYLTEDHVTDWQLNSLVSPPDVEFYDHRHVLRTNLNGTWGDLLISGGAAVGDTLTATFTDIAVDPAWNAANCALVGYVYNITSEEILQAAEREFEP